MKTRKEILDEFYDNTLKVIVNLEIEILFFKTQDKSKVLKQNKKVVAGIIMNEDFTIEMAIKEQEENLKDKKLLLEIIKKELEK
jgi:hypothetical protein